MNTNETSAPRELQPNNRCRLLTELALNGTSSRRRLARTTGLTGASVSRIVHGLLEDELVVENAATPLPGAGRPPRCVSINAGGGYLVAITVNAFIQRVMLLDLTNRILASRRVEMTHGDTAERILASVVAIVDELLQVHHVDRRRLYGCVFTAAGSTDPVQGTVHAPTIIGWERVHVEHFLGKRLGLPVRVERIPNAMLLANTRVGVAKGLRNIMLLNTSLTIGASLFLDGRLIHGSHFSAGCISRLTVPDGAGATRTVENAAGGWAVLQALYKTHPAKKSRRRFRTDIQRLQKSIARAQNDDPAAIAAFRACGGVMGTVVRFAADLLALEQVVVSGPLAAVPAYVEAIEAAVQHDNNTPSRVAPPAVCTSDIDSEEATRWLAVFEFIRSAE